MHGHRVKAFLIYGHLYILRLTYEVTLNRF